MSGNTSSAYLPWGQNDYLSEVFLRPYASWQNLSITFGCGMPVTQVDIMKSFLGTWVSRIPFPVQCMQLDLSAAGSTGFLTLGLLYDLFLCIGPVGLEYRSLASITNISKWTLTAGTRLRSVDEFFRQKGLNYLDTEMIDCSPKMAQSAILHVVGGSFVLFGKRRLTRRPGVSQWAPYMLGPMPKLLPWQGPMRMEPVWSNWTLDVLDAG